MTKIENALGLTKGEEILWEFTTEAVKQPLKKGFLVVLAGSSLFLLWMVIELANVPSGITIIFSICTALLLLIVLGIFFGFFSSYKQAKKQSVTQYIITNKRVVIHLKKQFLSFPKSSIKKKIFQENEDPTVDLIFVLDNKKISFQNLPQEEATKAFKLI